MKNIQLVRPTPAISIATMMNLTAIGLLAGLSFSVQFGLVPMLRRMDMAAYLNTMHEIIPAFTRSVKPLMLIGTITFLTRLLLHKPACRGARHWLLVSFVFFIAGAVITLAGHFPINDQLMKLPAQNPPVEWEALRLRWNELNFWRFAVAQLCFLAAMIPLAFGKRAQPVSE